MTRADGNPQRSFGEGLDLESRLAVVGRHVGREAGEQREVEATGAQSARENRARALTQREHDVGPITCEAVKRARYDARCRTRKRSQPDRPNPSRVLVVELALSVLHRLEGAAAWRSRTSPARLSRTPRRSRITSAWPAVVSSAAIRLEIADCV